MLLNDERVRILEEFLKNYEIRLTGSHIAKKKNLNQKTTSIALKGIEEEGFLKSAMQGRNKLYFLNLDDAETSVHFISAIEHLKAIEFYKRQQLIREIAAKIAPLCDGIVAIFGSYAKGTEKKDSDLDVFVAGKYDENGVRKVSEMYRIEINVKNYPLSGFKGALRKHDPFIEEVLANHILVKNIQQFVSYVRRLRYGKD